MASRRAMTVAQAIANEQRNYKEPLQQESVLAQKIGGKQVMIVIYSRQSELVGREYRTATYIDGKARGGDIIGYDNT